MHENNTFSNINEVVKPLNKPLILLVEDTPFIQYVHQRFLESMNCNVIIAETGAKALELFETKPNLVLMDVGLPGLSGIEVCRIIRSEEHTNRTPIIGLSAYGKIIEFECRAAGMDDFAVKPILASELYHLIYRWLPEFQSTLKPIK